MPTPTDHAVCSASASERWLHCTAAPRYEEQFPDNSSEYGEEGRTAHSVCELFGRKKFTPMSESAFTEALDDVKKSPYYNDEMLHTADVYVQFLTEKAMSFNGAPHVAFEVKVDYSHVAPEGFGTCDCIMFAGNTLRITDYKHGKGVAVSSIDNSQMRLYALGALKLYQAIYGDTITDVYTSIVQPRITEDVTEEHLTVPELKAWGESIKPTAQIAFTGMGATFEPGDWCKFCRGKAVCKARANRNTAFEEFKNCVPAGIPGAMTDAEIADLLTRAADLAAWYSDMQEYAQQAILTGHVLPGWKVVAGKSNRAFSDPEKAIKILKRKGYKVIDLYKPKEPKTLAMLEKMIGAKPFAEMLGSLIVKPMGKPTLVPESDKRDPYSPAAADFAGVTPNE